MFCGRVPWERYDQLLRSVNGVIDLSTRERCLVCGAYEAVAAGKPMILSRTATLMGYFARGAVFTDNRVSDSPHSIRQAILELRTREAELRAEVAILRRELTEVLRLDSQCCRLYFEHAPPRPGLTTAFADVASGLREATCSLAAATWSTGVIRRAFGSLTLGVGPSSRVGGEQTNTLAPVGHGGKPLETTKSPTLRAMSWRKTLEPRMSSTDGTRWPWRVSCVPGRAGVDVVLPLERSSAKSLGA